MLKKSLPGTVKRRTTEYSLLPKRFTFNDSRLTGGFDAIGCWTGLDLALGHDGGRATSFAAFVYLAIDDLHALEIFLDDFLPGEFNVLFRLSASPLANSVDHVLFDQYPNLLGQIGTGREFRHPPADDWAFCHVPLALAEQILV